MLSSREMLFEDENDTPEPYGDERDDHPPLSDADGVSDGEALAMYE